jgi:hypothetical protein
MNTHSTTTRIIALAIAVSAGLLSGCTGVKPWQRGPLSDYIMRPDRDPAADSLYEHVYFTREAATGGRGVGGGGCGCN